MPLQTIDGTDVQYYLLSFDENGVERREPDGTLLSAKVIARLADPAEKITDVFLASHGWKGDVPAAIEQYDKWMGEMAASRDRSAMQQKRPGFKAINVGIHWPSLPFGDENIPSGTGHTLGAGGDPLEQRVSEFAASVSNTPKAVDAIRTILVASEEDDGRSASLPADVSAAYKTLIAEAGLGDKTADLGAAPGDDHPAFDPDAMYAAVRDAESAIDGDDKLLGGSLLDKLKGLVQSPLQQLSFWKMKDRARAVGESGAHSLLISLMNAAPGTTKFHLMGHSFGCIVVSATVAGPPGGPALPRAVDTLFLVQGALSLWSFCPDIPFAKGTSGYFNRILAQKLVRGPLVTTRSSHDNAVGKLYPPAAQIKGQFVLDDELPKFGGVGTYGARGLGALADDAVMGDENHDYKFKAGRVYNIESSGIIATGGGASGAHSDIAHPEVAHVMWQAVAAAP
ncbi:MAG: hypothetical protein ABIY52_05300 [Gemmatimonadaceae bacterium]